MAYSGFVFCLFRTIEYVSFDLIFNRPLWSISEHTLHLSNISKRKEKLFALIFIGKEKKNLLWSFWEVTDWVGRSTQNVFLHKDVSLRKESE